MSVIWNGNKDEESFEGGSTPHSLFICKVSFPCLVPSSSSSLIALKQCCCCCCRTERHRHPCLPSLRLSIDSEGVSQWGKKGRKGGRNERQTDIVFLSAAVSDECALQGRVCRGVSSVYLSSYSLFLSLSPSFCIHLSICLSPCQHNNAATACGMMTAARAHCALLSRR